MPNAPGYKNKPKTEEQKRRNCEANKTYYARPEIREKKRAYDLEFRTRERLEQPWKVLVKGACTRARQRGISFDLTPEWASSVWTGKCAITGIEFRSNRGMGSGPGPFSPSIDRIEPELGYVPANCRFILHAVNALKGSGTDADVKIVVSSLFSALCG